MPAAHRHAALLDVPVRLWHALTRRREDTPADATVAAFDDGSRDRGNGHGRPAPPHRLVEIDVSGAAGEAAEGGPPRHAGPGARANGAPVAAPLSRGILDDMLGEIRDITGHFIAGGDLARGLAERLGDLPDAVLPLPEIGRENTRLLGLIREQAERTSSCVESLDTTLRDGHARADALAERQVKLIGQQTALLGAVRDALEENTRAAADAGESGAAMEAAADRLSTVAARLANAVEKASTSAHAREQRITRALDRTHRWTVAAVCTCAAVATLALVVLGIVLLG